MTKRHRSAVTGEFVSAEQAKADPERTVSERRITARAPDGMVMTYPPNDPEILARIEALEVAVAELRGRA